MSKSADETNEEAQALLGTAGLAVGSMNEAGASLHEGYLSFLDAGFTQRQSLWLVGTILSPMGPGRPPGADE